MGLILLEILCVIVVIVGFILAIVGAVRRNWLLLGICGGLVVIALIGGIANLIYMTHKVTEYVDEKVDAAGEKLFPEPTADELAWENDRDMRRDFEYCTNLHLPAEAQHLHHYSAGYIGGSSAYWSKFVIPAYFKDSLNKHVVGVTFDKASYELKGQHDYQNLSWWDEGKLMGNREHTIYYHGKLHHPASWTTYTLALDTMSWELYFHGTDS